MHGFFVTATNTDRGKTFVTGALRLWLTREGFNCLAMKPVQTGMEGKKLSPDLYSIYSLDYRQTPTEDEVYRDLQAHLPLLQPYCYQKACSPHLAAEFDGRPYVDVQHVVNCAQKLGQMDGCILLVEGAGGFYVPIDREKGMLVADIAERLGLPVILVGHSGLGAISDICLSLEAIRRRGLPVAGFLLNDIAPCSKASGYIRADNPQIISQLSGVPCLGTLPYMAKRPEREGLLRTFAALSGLAYLKPYLPQVSV